jgi:hypothetical protein
MYTLSLWVSGHGWRKLLETRSRRSALKRANELLPQEIKLELPNGYEAHAGLLHVGTDQGYSSDRTVGTLEEQIARWDNPRGNRVMGVNMRGTRNRRQSKRKVA